MRHFIALVAMLSSTLSIAADNQREQTFENLKRVYAQWLDFHCPESKKSFMTVS